MKIDSPFFEEFVKWRIELSGLLRRLAADLSRPVMAYEKDEAEIIYRPTQLLTTLFKGIVFQEISPDEWLKCISIQQRAGANAVQKVGLERLKLNKPAEDVQQIDQVARIFGEPALGLDAVER